MRPGLAIRSVRLVRNRPDSRPRLAGLTGGPGEAFGPDTSSHRRADRLRDDQSVAWQPAEYRDQDHRATIGGWTPGADDLGPAGDPGPTDDPGLADDPGPAEDRVRASHHDPGREGEPAVEDRRPGERAVPAPKPRRRHRSGHRPWARLAKRWVPESLRESRVDPGRRGALLLTVVAAVAALVAAVGVWWDRPQPRPVQSVSLSQLSSGVAPGATGSGVGLPGTAASGATLDAAELPPAEPSGRAAGRKDSASTAADSSTAAHPTVIVVSVTGAVHKPGLVRLRDGARVADAIEKAGGATSQANLTGLNLAQKLTDGASVVVADSVSATGSGSTVSGAGAGAGAGTGTGTGTESTGEPGSVPGPAGGKVDLNTADVAALDALPGVGPVTAASIVSWRQKNGHFTSVEQLQEIQGIGPAKYASLSPLVTV